MDPETSLFMNSPNQKKIYELSLHIVKKIPTFKWGPLKLPNTPTYPPLKFIGKQ